MSACCCQDPALDSSTLQFTLFAISTVFDQRIPSVKVRAMAVGRRRCRAHPATITATTTATTTMTMMTTHHCNVLSHVTHALGVCARHQLTARDCNLYIRVPKALLALQTVAASMSSLDSQTAMHRALYVLHAASDCTLRSRRASRITLRTAYCTHCTLHRRCGASVHRLVGCVLAGWRATRAHCLAPTTRSCRARASGTGGSRRSCSGGAASAPPLEPNTCPSPPSCRSWWTCTSEHRPPPQRS